MNPAPPAAKPLTLSAVTTDHLTTVAKTTLAEDSIRTIYRRTWAFRMAVVGIIGMMMASIAVMQILMTRKADGMWDAFALAIVPICWLIIALIPGMIWATGAKAVDIARIVASARGISDSGISVTATATTATEEDS